MVDIDSCGGTLWPKWKPKVQPSQTIFQPTCLVTECQCWIEQLKQDDYRTQHLPEVFDLSDMINNQWQVSRNKSEDFQGKEQVRLRISRSSFDSTSCLKHLIIISQW